MIKNVLKVNRKLFSNKINWINVNKFSFSSKNQNQPKVNETETTSQSSKEFEKRVNQVSKSDEEDFSSIEQYMKVFNEKVYKQNVELTNKLVEVFKEDNSPQGSKIFAAVNEINKINLNNTSKLLQVFLNQILKYNDSVRLFIQQSERNKSKFNYLVPLSLFFIWACGTLYLYSFFKRNYINYDKTIDNLIKFYNDNAPKYYKINTKFPIFDDHKNVTNSLNFDLHKHIVLIGPNSIGKTESVKHFCLTQALKDVLTVYIDLNTTNEESLQNLVRDKLLENYEGKDVNSFNYDLLKNENFSHKLLESIKTKQVYFVYDNYNHERDRQRVFNSGLSNITNTTNWRSLIVSSNNEIYQSAIEKNLEVKYVNFLQTRTYKNYLVEKLNTFAKKRVDFSNLELFTEDNINTLFKNFYYFSYDDLFRYLEANNSIQSYLLRKEERVIRKLKMLKLKDPQSYDLLNKLANQSGVKQFEWTKLPQNVNSGMIGTLENLELIFTRDYSDYVLLNSRIKELITKV